MWRLRAGNNTCFWKDKWCQNLVLKDIYPTLYRLEVNKSCIVSNRVNNRGIDFFHGMWSSGLRRGKEASLLIDLKKKLATITLTDYPDK